MQEVCPAQIACLQGFRDALQWSGRADRLRLPAILGVSGTGVPQCLKGPVPVAAGCGSRFTLLDAGARVAIACPRRATGRRVASIRSGRREVEDAEHRIVAGHHHLGDRAGPALRLRGRNRRPGRAGARSSTAASSYRPAAPRPLRDGKCTWSPLRQDRGGPYRPRAVGDTLRTGQRSVRRQDKVLLCAIADASDNLNHVAGRGVARSRVSDRGGLVPHTPRLSRIAVNDIKAFDHAASLPTSS
jgi:hypothetical protein